MRKVILCGACGRMGREIINLSFESNFWVIAGVDHKGGTIESVPIYQSMQEIPAEISDVADLIIDFSSAAMLEDILDYAVSQELPVIIAATGHTTEQKEKIALAADKIPLFISCNMSYGIGLFTAAVMLLAKEFSAIMDTEIIEFHHRYKKDAPSGTALMLAEHIKKSSGIPFEIVCGRDANAASRGEAEIGISSVRGGNTVGEHQVIFSGEDEVLTLTHRVESRRSFAKGTFKVAKFMLEAPAGLYDWEAIL